MKKTYSLFHCLIIQHFKYAQEITNFPLEATEFYQAGTPKINARTDPAIPSSNAVVFFDGLGLGEWQSIANNFENASLFSVDA